MYSPQSPQQPQPYQPAPYGQPPYGQPPAAQPPKDPNVGLLLELIGFLGFQGIGWLWAGETAIGLGLLIGWFVFLAVEVVLMFVLIGFCLLPLNLIVPIVSGVILMNRLKARQAAAASWPPY